MDRYEGDEGRGFEKGAVESEWISKKREEDRESGDNKHAVQVRQIFW